MLQKRKDNGYWGYPGGSMELGESFEETARREALEQRFFDLTQLPEGISSINMEVIQKYIILKSDRNGKQYDG